MVRFNTKASSCTYHEYHYVINVSMETHYKLSSTMSGLIASGNHFGAFPILLFVDLHVEGRSKPRCMAAAVLVMLLGSLFLVLPC